jgi:hypothetical protein
MNSPSIKALMELLTGKNNLVESFSINLFFLRWKKRVENSWFIKKFWEFQFCVQPVETFFGFSFWLGKVDRCFWRLSPARTF